MSSSNFFCSLRSLMAIGFATITVGCGSSPPPPASAPPEVPIADTSSPPASTANAATTMTDSAPTTPAPTSERTTTSSIADSKWMFCGMDKGVTFNADHSLVMDNSKCGVQSRWDQTGDHVVFDCNGFTIFDAKLTKPKRMNGRWHRGETPDKTFPTCLEQNP